MSIIFQRPNVLGFSFFSRLNVKGSSRRQNLCFALTPSTSQQTIEDDSQQWMKRGLLISSFLDGILNNPPAQDFLMKSIAQTMLAEQQQRAEQALHDSALQSPCCGPNMAALETLEQIDQVLQQAAMDWGNDKVTPQLFSTTPLRFVYIPTAMYAIRRDSQSTPGKQRQRARADAKQRRNTIVQFLNEKLSCNSSHLSHQESNILSVTLDLENGSIKHLEGSKNVNDFPTSGVDALQHWAPHLIYVEGGNTFWLHHCMKKGGWDSLLKQACCQGNAVYCGKSAGAILAGYSVETACWKGWDDPSIVPGMSEYSDWKCVRGLGLVAKLSFFPHMATEWEARVETLGKELVGGELCCLADHQVCCVDGVAKRIVVFSSSPKSVERSDSFAEVFSHLAGTSDIQ